MYVVTGDPNNRNDKTRYVVNGCSKTCDYYEAFSTTPRMEFIRIFRQLVANFILFLYQINVQNAYFFASTH